jgi:hypothetical protein
MLRSSKKPRPSAARNNDDEEVVVSHNDEPQMLGQTGDDKEDPVEGWEELFGRSAEVPIDVGDDGGDAAAREEEVESQSTATKEATRSCTSDVWDDFEKIFKVVNSKNIHVSAKCNHCGQIYAARSTIGTGSLLRHRMKCSIRNQKARGVSQSPIRLSLMVVLLSGSIVMMLLVLSFVA